MRRRFRRQIRRSFRQEVPPILQEANLAFSKGEYGRAAELFEKIARSADERGGPRAPLFHLQAGRARVFAGQTDLGMPSIKRGLDLFAQRRHFQRFYQAGRRIISELNKCGSKNEAAEVKAWLNSASPEPPTFDSPDKRPTLPTHCPACGAPLRHDEVDWLDEAIAECGYCGSPVHEEK